MEDERFGKIIFFAFIATSFFDEATKLTFVWILLLLLKAIKNMYLLTNGYKSALSLE